LITVLATLPRSGTTITRLVFWHVFGKFSYGPDMGTDLGPWIKFPEAKVIPKDKHAVTYKKWYASAAQYFFRSHFRLSPKSQCTCKKKFHKVILVVRDGRAVATSTWHHLRDYHKKKNISLNAVIEGKAGSGSWSVYLNSWERLLTSNNLLLLKYEDYINCPEKNIKLIGEFIGCDPIREWSNPFKEYKALDATSRRFFRKGEVDSWRSEMSLEQEKRFRQLNGKWLKKLGYIK